MSRPAPSHRDAPSSASDGDSDADMRSDASSSSSSDSEPELRRSERRIEADIRGRELVRAIKQKVL